jgi:hypothetical protein
VDKMAETETWSNDRHIKHGFLGTGLSHFSLKESKCKVVPVHS